MVGLAVIRITAGGIDTLGGLDAVARGVVSTAGVGASNSFLTLHVTNWVEVGDLRLTDSLLGNANSSVQVSFAAGSSLPQLQFQGNSLTDHNSSIGMFNFKNASNNSMSGESGTQTVMRVGVGFAPTNGTAEYRGFEVAGTINQTGGSSGITRGLFINPTVTAASDYRAVDIPTGVVFIAEGASSNKIWTCVDSTTGKGSWQPAAASGGGASMPTNIVLQCDGWAAYGSTDTMIVRFLNTTTNTGENVAWNYTTNAANGSTLTFLQNGIYSISATTSGAANGTAAMGITVDESSPLTTTNFIYASALQSSLTNMVWSYHSSTAASDVNAEAISVTSYFSSGQVVRVHTNGTNPANTSFAKLRATQIVR